MSVLTLDLVPFAIQGSMHLYLARRHHTADGKWVLALFEVRHYSAQSSWLIFNGQLSAEWQPVSDFVIYDCPGTPVDEAAQEIIKNIAMGMLQNTGVPIDVHDPGQPLVHKLQLTLLPLCDFSEQSEQPGHMSRHMSRQWSTLSDISRIGVPDGVPEGMLDFEACELPQGCPSETPAVVERPYKKHKSDRNGPDTSTSKGSRVAIVESQGVVLLPTPSGLLICASTDGESLEPPVLSHEQNKTAKENTEQLLEVYGIYDPATRKVRAGESHPVVDLATINRGANAAENVRGPTIPVAVVGHPKLLPLVRATFTGAFSPTNQVDSIADTAELKVFLANLQVLAESMFAIYARFLRDRWQSGGTSTVSDSELKEVTLAIRRITMGLCKTTARSSSQPAPGVHKNMVTSGFVPTADGQTLRYKAGKDRRESPFHLETGKMSRSILFLYLKFVFALEHFALGDGVRFLDGLGKELDKFSRWYRQQIMKDKEGVQNEDPTFVAETLHIPGYIVFADKQLLRSVNWETYGRLFFTFLIRFCEATGRKKLTLYVQ